MAEQKLVVDGYLFASEAEAKQAQAEFQRIQLFDERVDYSSTENVLMLYDKILEEHPFKTQVGMEYVKKLRKILLGRGIPENEIAEIPVDSFSRAGRRMAFEKRAKRRVELVQTNHVKQAFRVSVLLNVFLFVLVIAMLVITLSSDNPNILNYKRNLINQYASWEQELTARENKVREAELAYHLIDGDKYERD